MTPASFENPIKVQKSLDDFLTRCIHGTEGKDYVEGVDVVEKKPTESFATPDDKSTFTLSPFQRMNLKVSLSNNWTRFWKGTMEPASSPSHRGYSDDQDGNENDSAHAGLHPIVLHLPVYDSEFVTSNFPRNMSMMTLFTFQPSSSSTASESSLNTVESHDQESNPKLGAFVVAPRSLWSKIEASGMVGGYYWSFRQDPATNADSNVDHGCCKEENEPSEMAAVEEEECFADKVITSDDSAESHPTYGNPTVSTSSDRVQSAMRNHPRSMLNSYIASLRREALPSGDDCQLR